MKIRDLKFKGKTIPVKALKIVIAIGIIIFIVCVISCIKNNNAKKVLAEIIDTSISDFENELKKEAYSSGDYYTINNITYKIKKFQSDTYDFGDKLACIEIFCDIDYKGSYIQRKAEEHFAIDFLRALPKEYDSDVFNRNVKIHEFDMLSFWSKKIGVDIYVNNNCYIKNNDTVSILNAVAEDKKNQEKFDDYMAGQDWGDNYYYDTGDHKVKKNLHGILN